MSDDPALQDALALRIVLGATLADLPTRFALRPGYTVVDVPRFLASVRADLYGHPELRVPPLDPDRGWANVRAAARVITEAHQDAERALPDAGLFA